jgi:predicted dehydrogenase
MKKNRVSRRRFLRHAAGVAVPLAISAGVLAASGRPGANDRIRIGAVGTGIRGRSLIRDMPAEGRVAAICDCYRPRMLRVLKPAPGSSDAVTPAPFLASDVASCATFQDYRRMIGEARLDAVMIAACDHHHVLAAMLACQAGLDVYCEKPLSLTVAEGQKLVEAVNRYGRVLQVGSQQRSMEMDRFACRFVREGGLGRVSCAEVQNWPGPLEYDGLPEETLPEGMDWDLFCGPTPLRPYNWRLWQKDERKFEGKNWRGWDMWRSYSGHLMTNWGAHAVDLVQWALGMDHTGPTEIRPLTEGYTGEPQLCPVVATYAGGVELRIMDPKGFNGGSVFHGERGRISIARNGFQAFPKDLITDPPNPSTAEVWNGPGIVARPHLQNWLDCVKSRAKPNAPVEVGHRSVTICHLAGIARRLGRTLRWDPEQQTFPGDDEANALLDRPRRPGWELPSLGRPPLD